MTPVKHAASVKYYVDDDGFASVYGASPEKKQKTSLHTINCDDSDADAELLAAASMAEPLPAGGWEYELVAHVWSDMGFTQTHDRHHSSFSYMYVIHDCVSNI